MTEASPLDLLWVEQLQVDLPDFIPVPEDGQESPVPAPSPVPRLYFRSCWNAIPAQAVPQLMEVHLAPKVQQKSSNKLKLLLF